MKKKICMITVVILEHFFSNPDMPQQNPCTLFLAVSSRISKVSPCRHKDFLKYIARVMNIEMVMPIALYNVPFDFFRYPFSLRSGLLSVPVPFSFFTIFQDINTPLFHMDRDKNDRTCMIRFLFL